MIRVIVLGGAGRFGRSATRVLADAEEVDEVVVAGRSEAIARAQADSLGPKGRAAQVDAMDEAALTGLLDGAALILNATGPYFQTLLPVLHAAIGSGVHYTDFAEDGRAFEAALALDGNAKAAGVTAISGIGQGPGLTNLLCLYAAAKLDEVDEVRIAWQIDIEAVIGNAEEALRELDKTDRLNATVQALMRSRTGSLRSFRNGALVDIEPFGESARITLIDGSVIEVDPFGTLEPVSLPPHLPGVLHVTSWQRYYPASSEELVREQVARMMRGKVDAREAAITVFRRLAAEPERYLDRSGEGAAFGVIQEAWGRKDGRAARCAVEGAWNDDPAITDIGVYTGTPCALAALKILRGEAAEPGVFGPEHFFAPESFLRELLSVGKPSILKPELVIESFDWLE